MARFLDMYYSDAAWAASELEVPMRRTLMAQPEDIQNRFRRIGEVRWMSFYDRRLPLHYDKYVRTYAPKGRVRRVWFYENRLKIGAL